MDTTSVLLEHRTVNDKCLWEFGYGSGVCYLGDAARNGCTLESGLRR